MPSRLASIERRFRSVEIPCSFPSELAADLALLVSLLPGADSGA